MPQFIMGARNVVASFLSRNNQVIGSKLTLAQEVVLGLLTTWPATIDLFAMALNYCLPIYFSLLEDPMSAGTDAFLQCWDNLQAYALPPFALIQKVINKLQVSKGTLLTLITPYWPQREWFSDLQALSVDRPIVLPCWKDLLRQPLFIIFRQISKHFVFMLVDYQVICTSPRCPLWSY